MNKWIEKIPVTLATLFVFAFGFATAMAWNHYNPPQVRVQDTLPCPDWIQTISSPSGSHYARMDCRYAETGGTSVYITVLDKNGAPVSGINVHQAWPEGDISQVTQGGVTSFPMGPSNCDPNAGRPGALSYYVTSRDVSDEVKGFCLPLNRHYDWWLTFKFTDSITPTPITPVPITPTPDDYVTHSEFRNLLINTLIDILTNGK